MALRAVVADDLVLIREGIAHVLRSAGVEVVGEIGDAAALLEAVERYRPGIAVVDIRMPPSNTVEGIVAAMTIRERHPETAVLLLSHHVEIDSAMKLLAGGAAGIGYLLKDRVSDITDFISSVTAVASGGTRLDPILATRMMERPHRGRRPLDELTGREREVLALMAEGKSNQAIASQLLLGRRTVEAHVSAIFGKLGLRPAPDDDRRVMAVLIHLKSSSG